MKRLLVFVPAILLAFFLLNSFVLKEKDVGKVIRNKSWLLNTVFKFTGGGQTWHDISKGLPENLWEDGIQGNSKGKTWKLLFPSIKDKVFTLSGSGNLIYAIPSKGGC